jgi:mono/diheme cytochrome c family protein
MAMCALVGVAWTVGVTAAVRAEQGASTWSGVYTEGQAKTGLELYTKHCAECHGGDLGGDGFAPGLKGPEFMNNWNGLTVGELYDRIRISMPPNNPQALGAKEKVDVVAYILKEDGFPAGEKELPATVDALKSIKFEATKPGR